MIPVPPGAADRPVKTLMYFMVVSTWIEEGLAF